MCHFSTLFLSHDGASHRASHVAHHKDQIRWMRHQVLLEGNHNSGGLFRLSASPTTQINIRLGNIELFEESLAHLSVIVLTSMNETILDIFVLLLCLLDGMNQRGDFHEIGASACNKGDMRHFI